MSAVEDSKDLVVLAADKDMEHAVKGILGRWKSLQIRELTWDIFVHPNRDPGCLLEAHEFLRDHSGRYRRAIIMLDRDGCGKESSGASAIESGIEERLRNYRLGWPLRSDSACSRTGGLGLERLARSAACAWLGRRPATTARPAYRAGTS